MYFCRSLMYWMIIFKVIENFKILSLLSWLVMWLKLFHKNLTEFFNYPKSSPKTESRKAYNATKAEHGCEHHIVCEFDFGVWNCTTTPDSHSRVTVELYSFLARDNIYISRLCHDASPSVLLSVSVTEVQWRIITNLGFKFRYHITAHYGKQHSRRAACSMAAPCCSQCCLRVDHLAPC